MDTEREPAARPGGTVEPANRASVARRVFQTPNDLPGTRYELHDPFAAVTYRSSSFMEMTAKADQLGAPRFHEVADDGSRRAVEKAAGEWTRPGAASTVHRLREVAGQSRNAASTATGDREAVIAKVDLDAERVARVERLEAALSKRYVVKRAALKVGDLSIGTSEYRYRGDTSRIAFTETTFRLATDTNQPSVARSMVDVAEARNWQALRVSGSEDFKRLIWLEASLRGVRAVGYVPQLADQELLKQERETRSVNRIEPLAPNQGSARNDSKQSARGGGGRKAVLAALEAVLTAKGVPAKLREAVMEAATERLTARGRIGQVHKVKVFDRDAPAQRAEPAITREIRQMQDQTR